MPRISRDQDATASHQVFQSPSGRGVLQPRSARKSLCAGRSPSRPLRRKAFTKFANYLCPSNSRHSNHLPSHAAFSPAALRLPAVYNVASGGLRESDFAPRKGIPDAPVRFTPG
jgi:hypothetical protein